MKRQGWITLAGLILGLVLAPQVSANEGVVRVGAGNFAGECYFTSVYIDGRFRVLGSCRELLTPYSTKEDRYFVWAQDEEGDIFRVGELERGKLDKSVGWEFSRLFLTAEAESSPRKPRGAELASGTVEAMPFRPEADQPLADEGGVDEDIEVRPLEEVGPLQPMTQTAATPSGFARVLGAIGRVVLTGVLILIGVAVVMGIVMKRKEGNG